MLGRQNNRMSTENTDGLFATELRKGKLHRGVDEE